MATITVSEQLSSIGQEIKNMEADFSTILSDIKNTVTQIAGVWDGLGHEGFVSDYTTQQQNLENLPQIITDLGAAIMEIAETWQNVDTQIGQR